MLTPTTEQDLAQIIAAAKGPLRILGGGTRPTGYSDGDDLSTRKLSGITLYEPGALTMVARAGTPLAEVEAALAMENQQLAFEPMDHRPLLRIKGEPTIGGVFAANVSGPRRIQCGAARDFLLGVRFIDGQGRILTNGGRVMKNVTGYDLVKLMAGSRGTLGVMSEVSFKVLPAPEHSATLELNALSPAAAVHVMARALGSPFDITGAAYLPGPNSTASRTCFRLEGFTDSVRYRLQALSSWLSANVDPKVIEEQHAHSELWRGIRDVSRFKDHVAVWRISTKPSNSLKLLDMMDQMHSYDWMLDWGGGLLWIAVTQNHLLQIASYGDEGKHDEPLEGIRVLHENLRHNVGLLGGHATLTKAPNDARAVLNAFQSEPLPVAALSNRIRQKFDPRAILNPGLMEG